MHAIRLPALLRIGCAALLAAGSVVHAAGEPPPADVIVPNAHLKADGVPPIPATLAAKLAPYTEFRPRFVASWMPAQRALLVATRVANTVQLNRVAAPLATLAPVTDYADPVRWGVYWPSRPTSLVFMRDAGGNEQRQVYRLDAGAKEPALLTDPARLHSVEAVNHARTRLLVAARDLDKTGKRENPATDLLLLDPLHPDGKRRIATLPGTGWDEFAFSFDDRRVAMVDQRSINDGRVEVMDVATGKRTRVLPAGDAEPATKIFSSSPQFSRDGRGLFLTTDRDGEWQRAAYLDLASGTLRYFGPDRWDVEELVLSPDGRTLALVVNEAGTGVLQLFDAATRQRIAQPALPAGKVSGLRWRDDSSELAFNLDSARGPSDVYSVLRNGAGVTRWTASTVAGVDANAFMPAEPFEYASFDGTTVYGFITRPPARFTGPRPVLVDIHGGPEAQSRPGFMGRWNYFINELGIAVIEPNVRGSAGYGKTYVAMDNGRLREDSVRDIGSLFDWIAKQPGLDASRIVVAGGSYGGYMSLAVATHYADRIAGSIDVVGIANFVSFLENTESYRRDLRRVEYGDERDPEMRKFLLSISPLNNASKITKPLFVVQGKNDPRVPYTESEQIVTTARRNGVQVWYLTADNEGHGFARKDNADFYFYTMVRFVEDTLLK
jgi:dipeptidyl aminopeptidase/acylaminoacyl peptidase